MPIDPTPEGGEILHQPVVKPFPEASSEHEEKAALHETQPAEGGVVGAKPIVQADLLGHNTVLQAPRSSAELSQTEACTVPGVIKEFAAAEDENQPGFPGDRRRSKP